MPNHPNSYGQIGRRLSILDIDNNSKLSIKLFIYESGPNHEEMEDVLCT